MHQLETDHDDPNGFGGHAKEEPSRHPSLRLAHEDRFQDARPILRRGNRDARAKLLQIHVRPSSLRASPFRLQKQVQRTIFRLFSEEIRAEDHPAVSTGSQSGVTRLRQ